jgi:chorismate mutase-like protein
MTLEEVRVQIDEIDRELVRLLNQRAELVNVVGQIKHAAGLEIYAPEREEKLLRKLVAVNEEQKGKLTERSIRAIYREIMSAALALEHPLRIMYLGPAGSRAHQVAIAKFGHGLSYAAEPKITELLSRLAQQEADYAVLPMEHSADGGIQHSLDYFSGLDLQICAQMRIVADESELPVRYLILGRRGASPTGEDCTMLRVDAPDRVGALRHVLESFEKAGVNVRQIENRPADGKHARFFLEVDGHQLDQAITAALIELGSQGASTQVLGSYPASNWVEALG